MFSSLVAQSVGSLWQCSVIRWLSTCVTVGQWAPVLTIATQWPPLRSKWVKHSDCDCSKIPWERQHYNNQILNITIYTKDNLCELFYHEGMFSISCWIQLLLGGWRQLNFRRVYLFLSVITKSCWIMSSIFFHTSLLLYIPYIFYLNRSGLEL
jgi:hypothetical protein